MSSTLRLFEVGGIHGSSKSCMTNMVCQHSPGQNLSHIPIETTNTVAGPIIRINPDELHINDPEFYDEVYCNSKGRVEKPLRAADAFGPVPSTFGTVEHELHRLRRAPLSSHSSKRSVGKLQPLISGSILKLCDRFERASEHGETVNLKYAFAALGRDIIYRYCFSRELDSVLVSDFDQDYVDVLEAGQNMTPIVSQVDCA